MTSKARITAFLRLNRTHRQRMSNRAHSKPKERCATTTGVITVQKSAAQFSSHLFSRLKTICLCLCVVGGGRSFAPRPHSEPAGDLQNPKYPSWNAGASGGDAADGVRRQRPDLHLHLPVHLQSLHQRSDRAADAAGQVGPERGRLELGVFFMQIPARRQNNTLSRD